MDQNTMLFIVLGGLAVLFLLKSGHLKLPRPQAQPPTTTVMPAAAGVQHIVLHHEVQAPSQPSGEGPVHETQVQVPLTIRVIPRGPVPPSVL